MGVEQPGFADLVDLVKAGKAYVKISGAYRASKLGPDYRRLHPAREGADRAPIPTASSGAPTGRIRIR